jgi:hypothetical protein
MRVIQIVAGTVLALATVGTLAACGSRLTGTATPALATITTTTTPITTAAPAATVYVQPPVTHTVYVTPAPAYVPAPPVYSSTSYYIIESCYVGAGNHLFATIDVYNQANVEQGVKGLLSFYESGTKVGQGGFSALPFAVLATVTVNSADPADPQAHQSVPNPTGDLTCAVDSINMF